MNPSTSQLYMAAINLLAASTAKGEEVTREDILWAIDIASRTAEELEDTKPTIVPADEEVKKVVTQAFNTMYKKKFSKSMLRNAMMLKCGYRRFIADYVIERAEVLNIVKSSPRGNCIDYSLA